MLACCAKSRSLATRRELEHSSQSSLIVAIADGVPAALSLQKEFSLWNQVQENRVVQLQIRVRASLANVASSVSFSN